MKTSTSLSLLVFDRAIQISGYCAILVATSGYSAVLEPKQEAIARFWFYNELQKLVVIAPFWFRNDHQVVKFG